MFLVLATLFVVTGCSAIPGLRLPPAISFTGIDMGEAISSAQSAQIIYGDQITVLADDVQKNAKFNLIDGTALAAASVFNGNRNFLRLFGLAGGASLALDGTFVPAVQSGAYESAYGAINCMIDLARKLNSGVETLRLASPKGTNLFTTASKSLALVTTKVATADAVETKTAALEAENQNKVRMAAVVPYLKIYATLQEAEGVDELGVFKSKLVALDHSLRKKIREALKPQGATGFRDGLIATALEAQKKKDDMKTAEMTIDILAAGNSLDVGITQAAKAATAAANKVTFSSDLSVCIASAGL